MRQILVKGEPGVMSAAKLGLAGPSAPLSATENKENEPHGLDGETVSTPMLDRQNQNAMSAFEITSVDPVPADNDDLDSSIVQKSLSSDDSLKAKIQRMRLESGGSISEDPTHSQELHVQAEDAQESVSNLPTPTAITPGDDHTSKDVQPDTTAADQDAVPVQSGSIVIAPPAITQQLPQSQPLLQGVGAAGNGPTLQQGASRFRRVNQYTRGRWSVRDKTEPEERPDSELKGPTCIQALRSDSVVSTGSGSPLVPRKTQPVAEIPEALHTRNANELTQPPSSVPSDNVSDKESPSIHVDKSSTAADTLSRNTSLSSTSIVAMTDKSLDGDDRLRDLEPELGLLRDSSDITYPLPPTTNLPPSGTSSSSVAIPTPVGAPNSTTANPTPAPAQTDSQGPSNSHGPSCSCESCLEGKGQERPQPVQVQQRVQHAMSYLHKELEVLLKNNKEMETLTQRNNQLEEENKSLKEMNSRLTAEIERLKAELAKHTDSQRTEGHGGVS